VLATVLTRANLADDVRGINASIELIQKTCGGGWSSSMMPRPALRQAEHQPRSAMHQG
jgi:hypothetical protein